MSREEKAKGWRLAGQDRTGLQRVQQMAVTRGASASDRRRMVPALIDAMTETWSISVT